MTQKRIPEGAGLEERIKEAVSLAKTAPPEYREKTFEILLKILCSPNTYVKPLLDSGDADDEYKLPTHVEAFVKQFDISESNIKDHFVINGSDDIVKKYTIENNTMSRSQIEIACMLALENALHGAKFEFSFEEAKTACEENHCFDKYHFMKNFKNRRNMFKSLDMKENIELTSDGKKYLKDLLIKLSNKLSNKPAS